MAYRIKRSWSTPLFAVLYWAEDSLWRMALLASVVIALVLWLAVQLDAWQRRSCIANGGHMVEEKVWVPQYTKVGDVMVHTGTHRSTVSYCEGERK